MSKEDKDSKPSKTYNIKIKLINKDCKPFYSTSRSNGFDCMANLVRPLTIPPMKRAMIPLGFALDLDDGYYVDLRPRSGLGIKKGLTLINTPGLIDSDFTKELQALVVNLSKETVIINPLDKICQGMVKREKQVSWEEVDEIKPREEKHEGFGSTDVIKHAS